MPDFNIEHCYTCASNIHWEKEVHGKSGTYHVRYGRLPPDAPYEYGWTCTCPQFVYRKKECKHIEQAKTERCGWNEEAFCGSHGEPTEDGKCPECGGDVEVVRVAV